MDIRDSQRDQQIQNGGEGRDVRRVLLWVSIRKNTAVTCVGQSLKSI